MEENKAVFDGAKMTTLRNIQKQHKVYQCSCMDTNNRIAWRDLQFNYGKCGTAHQRFIRWQRKSIWKKLFEIFKGNKKFEWLMVDSTYVKDQQHSLAEGIKPY